MTTGNYTGLNTYALRTESSTFVQDPTTRSTTCFVDHAYSWLWTPEEAPARAEAMTPQLRLGRLTAVRSRP